MQAVTREIPSKSAENINNDIDEIVEKALTKAKKVVLSTVVAREEKRDIQYKIYGINANIMYKYRENERVLICNNSNLNDENFRRTDKLHLNDHGVAVLATNLKYIIAKSLDVRVIKKERR